MRKIRERSDENRTTRIIMALLNERQDAAVKGGKERREGKLWKEMELIRRGEYI